MKARIEWIDYAKFIGIFLVVFGHTHLPPTVINIIYSFHMPLFFFISGLLFDLKKYPSFSGFAVHRFRQLIIPYFFFNLLTLLFWFFVGRKFGRDATEDIPLIQPVMGVFYGVDSGNYLIHCGSLWFLPCLFVTELLFFAGAKYLNSVITILLIPVVVGFINYKLHHFMFLFSFDVALVALLFYAAGNLMSPFAKKEIKLTALYSLLLFVAFFVLLIVLEPVNQRVDMSSNIYPNYFVFIITALTGITATLALAMFISTLIGDNPIISYFAMNTLTILAFHEIIASLIKGLLYFIVRIPVSIFEQNILLNLVLTVLSFISLVPVIFLMNKYVPFVPGYKNRQ